MSACFYCHCQDLAAQVSAETDPVTLLPKVVSLLYMQVHCLNSWLGYQLLLFMQFLNLGFVFCRFTIKLYKPLEGPFLSLFLD